MVTWQHFMTYLTQITGVLLPSSTVTRDCLTGLACSKWDDMAWLYVANGEWWVHESDAQKRCRHRVHWERGVVRQPWLTRLCGPLLTRLETVGWLGLVRGGDPGSITWGQCSVSSCSQLVSLKKVAFKGTCIGNFILMRRQCFSSPTFVWRWKAVICLDVFLVVFVIIVILIIILQVSVEEAVAGVLALPVADVVDLTTKQADTSGSGTTASHGGDKVQLF